MCLLNTVLIDNNPQYCVLFGIKQFKKAKQGNLSHLLFLHDLIRLLGLN